MQGYRKLTGKVQLTNRSGRIFLRVLLQMWLSCSGSNLVGPTHLFGLNSVIETKKAQANRPFSYPNLERLQDEYSEATLKGQPEVP